MWIAVLVVLILLATMMRWSPMTWQQSITGKSYYVKRGPGQELVANRLELLTHHTNKFLDAADDAYPGDFRIANIRARWNGTLAETTDSSGIAYSLNKTSVHVCVRSPEGGLESINTTMYVLLHEIAHVATDTFGHPPEFWTNFRWILEAAEKLGVYTYEDFDAIQVTFCGHQLGNSVMKCVKKNTCKSLLV